MGNRYPTGESPGMRNICFDREKPRLAGPARNARSGWYPAERKYVADHLTQSLFEKARYAAPLDWIFQLRVKRIDIDRKPPLLPQIIEDVFVGGDGE